MVEYGAELPFTLLTLKIVALAVIAAQNATRVRIVFLIVTKEFELISLIFIIMLQR
jgi:hypothetical protein